jgi:GNAT superfamily N-acetyltransferase
MVASGSTRESMETPTVSIVEFTPPLAGPLLRFFDRDAFVDNPRWSACYCHFNHADHELRPWSERTAAENRAATGERLGRGRMHGYLALAGSTVVGWCNADLADAYTTLDLPPRDRAGIGAIVCFLVAKPYRGNGIARRLLDAACRGFESRGMAVVEGYARTDTKDPADNHHGPLSMYLNAGFHVDREDGRIAVLVKSLKGSTPSREVDHD